MILVTSFSRVVANDDDNQYVLSDEKNKSFFYVSTTINASITTTILVSTQFTSTILSDLIISIISFDVSFIIQLPLMDYFYL